MLVNLDLPQRFANTDSLDKFDSSVWAQLQAEQKRDGSVPLQRHHFSISVRSSPFHGALYRASNTTARAPDTLGVKIVIKSAT